MSNGDPNTYRTVAQDIESAKTPFTQEQWRQYYTPQQMTGGEKMSILTQLPQAPVITAGNLGTSLYESQYKFNGVPSVKEVKSDGTTINPSGGSYSPQVRTVARRSKTTKKRTRRAVKPDSKQVKHRRTSSKARSKAARGKTKARSVRVSSKMPEGLRKYWENKRKKGGK